MGPVEKIRRRERQGEELMREKRAIVCGRGGRRAPGGSVAGASRWRSHEADGESTLERVEECRGYARHCRWVRANLRQVVVHRDSK